MEAVGESGGGEGFLVDADFAACLDAFDFGGGAGDVVAGEEDGDIDGEGAGGARGEFGDATGEAFDAAVEGVAGAGFEAGDVTLLGGGEVFPEGEVGELFDGEAEGDAAVGARAMDHGEGAAGGIGGGFDAIDLFDEAAGGAGVFGEAFDVAGGVVVEGGDAADGGGEAAAGLEEGCAEVAVVDHLELLVMGSVVGDGVLDAEGRGAGVGGDLGPQFQFRAVEHAFVDAAADAEAERGVGVDEDLDFAGGDIGDAPVEGEVHFGAVAGVVDEGVLAGVAGPFEAAADHPFVEALEPAEAAAAFEVDAVGVDDLLDGGIPAEADVAGGGFEDAHAAGGDDREGEEAVVDDDDVDALLASAVEGEFADAPGGGEAEVAVGEGPLVGADAAGGAGDDLAEGFGGWGLGVGEHGGEEEEWEQAFHGKDGGEVTGVGGGKGTAEMGL